MFKSMFPIIREIVHQNQHDDLKWTGKPSQVQNRRYVEHIPQSHKRRQYDPGEYRKKKDKQNTGKAVGERVSLSLGDQLDRYAERQS